jgi:REP-associated tyrosine transposase
MVTTETWGRRALLRAEPWARLLLDALYHYRGTAYLLHAFVVMPDHVHFLMTPLTSLEKAVQFIKGGFSYRAKKELGSSMEVWQKGFTDHRIRDEEDCARHIAYIHQNPVRKHLSEVPGTYAYSSAHPGFELDEVPQGLKPQNLVCSNGAPEGAPLQTKADRLGAVGSTFPQGLKPDPVMTSKGTPEGAPLQLKTDRIGAAEAVPLQRQTIKSSKGVA